MAFDSHKLNTKKKLSNAAQGDDINYQLSANVGVVLIEKLVHYFSS